MCCLLHMHNTHTNKHTHTPLDYQHGDVQSSSRQLLSTLYEEGSVQFMGTHTHTHTHTHTLQITPMSGTGHSSEHPRLCPVAKPTLQHSLTHTHIPNKS